MTLGGSRGRPPAARVSAWIALVLFGSAAAGSCVTRPSAPPGARRVAVVGVDGATWSVLSPLLAAGRLPRLASLYRGGSAGLLRSLEPMEPAALWTSIATGKSRAAHGIRRSVEKVPGRYAVRPVTADRRRAPALWTVASARGLSVGLSGWPVTFPAESLDGFVLADGLDEGVLEERGFMHPSGALAGWDAAAGGEAAALARVTGRIEALDSRVGDAAREDAASLLRALSLYRVYQPRLLLVRIRAVDVASHRHWPRPEAGREQGEETHPDRPEAGAGGPAWRGGEDPSLQGGPLLEAYLFVEACLELLMRQLPEETALLVLSDHGFRAARPTDARRVDMEALLERLGYLEHGPDGVPDWERTRLFRLEETDDPDRLVYLNLAGREERGSVAPSQAAAVRAEAAQVLRSLASDRGEPIFLEVTETDDPAPGEPDLEVRESRRLDPAGVLLLPSGERVPLARILRRISDGPGTHELAGVLLAFGSGVAAGRTGWTADLYDVAPTILVLLGLPLPSDMPGRPIDDLLAASPPAERSVVPSYNALAPAPPPVLRSERGSRAALERMRDAGHLR